MYSGITKDFHFETTVLILPEVFQAQNRLVSPGTLLAGSERFNFELGMFYLDRNRNAFVRKKLLTLWHKNEQRECQLRQRYQVPELNPPLKIPLALCIRKGVLHYYY